MYVDVECGVVLPMPLLVNRAFSIITSRKLVFLFRFFEMCALALGGDSVSVRASFFSRWQS